MGAKFQPCNFSLVKNCEGGEAALHLLKTLIAKQSKHGGKVPFLISRLVRNAGFPGGEAATHALIAGGSKGGSKF